MLFLVISTPRPDRPSAIARDRKRYWQWMDRLRASGMSRFVYARTGRGAVALFDVDSNQTLHRLVNEWSEIVPAHFDIYPLVDQKDVQRYLAQSSGAKKSARLLNRQEPADGDGDH